jgi:tRNA pseudouridine38-40 synthase
MRAAGSLLIGRHDFAAFQGAGSSAGSTERTIHRLEWHEGRAFDRPMVLQIAGDGFLRHMVRNIAGTLVEIGLGRWKPARLAEILSSGTRAEAGPTAPPQGLFLVKVEY